MVTKAALKGHGSQSEVGPDLLDIQMQIHIVTKIIPLSDLLEPNIMDLKSKHFGFQYKLMGEGYKKYKTGAKSLNILSTSWKCSKEFELASLEA